MSVYSIFTSNPDHVQLVNGDLELFHSEHLDCDNAEACQTCKFADSLYCALPNNNPAYQPIFDYFKLHHPEKLL